MHDIPAYGFTVNQATWKGPVIRVIFNHFPTKDTGKYLFISDLLSH